MLSVSAAVAVKDVSCHQRYPWNGLVDIDYTVESDDATADVYVFPPLSRIFRLCAMTIGFDRHANGIWAVATPESRAASASCLAAFSFAAFPKCISRAASSAIP